jgi:MFS family permease
MKTVIGYLEPGEAPEAALHSLEGAGIPGERVDVLGKEAQVRTLLDIDPARAIARAAGLGALAGVGVYFLFALLAAWCQCNLLNFALAYGIEAFAGGILAGGLIGGVLGGIWGLAQLEDRCHLYIQGVRIGGAVLVARAEPGAVSTVTRALERAGLQGVRTLQGNAGAAEPNAHLVKNPRNG